MSYRLDAQVVFAYYPDNIMDFMQRPTTKTESLRQRLQHDTPEEPLPAKVLWLASICKVHSGRHHYVRELMRHIPVDSLGSCVDSGAHTERFKYNQVSLMCRYQFYLALGNSNCKDYVTEKLATTWDGPQDYSTFFLANAAAIQFDNYYNPKDLAVYLKQLSDSETLLWERHLSFRDFPEQQRRARQPINKEFDDFWNGQKIRTQDRLCSLCRLANEEMDSRSRAIWPINCDT
jgi:hypothetical protein